MAENSANVFSLQASISINTTNFEKKIEKIKKSGMELQQIMEKSTKSVEELQKFLNGFDSTKFKQGVKGIGKGLDGLGNSSEDSKEKIEDIGDSAEDTSKKSKNAFGTLKESVKATFSEMGDSFKMTGDSLQTSISQTAASFSKITSAVQNVIKAIEKVGEVAVKSFKVAVKAGEEFSKGIVNIVDKANDIENTISLAFGGAGAAIGTYAFTTGKDFESSMANVIAIMGKTKESVTDDGANIYNMLSDAAKEAGASTMFTATESADALGYLALAGYDAYKAVNALPTVLDIAKAGGMDLAYTSDLVTDAMNAMGLEATDKNLTNFGDVLAKTASSSNTSVSQLGEALLVCAGQAKIANVDLKETATMLGILADAGYKGSEGGTMFRNLLKNMYTPTAAAKKSMEALGLNRFDEEGKIKNVQVFLSEIVSTINNLESDEDKLQAYADLFDTRVIAGASIALEKCSDRYDELYGEIDKCDGAMEQMGKTMSDTLVGDMQTMTSRFQGVGLAIYDYIVPHLRDIVQDTTGYLAQLQQTIDEHGLSAGASTISDMVAESLKKNTPSIIKGIDKGRNIVQRFINGFVYDIPNISENIGEIIQAFGEARDKIFDSVAFVFGENSGSLVNIGATILDTMLATAENVTKRLAENIPQFIEEIANSLSENKDKWQRTITSIIKNISDLVVKSAPALVEIGSTLLVAIVEGMATTASEIAKILPTITDTISNLFQNKEFSENLSTASSQIIRSIGDVIVTAIKFIGDSDNIKAITDVLSNIFMEITSVLDEIAPEIMPHIQNLIEEVTLFVNEALTPFIVTVNGIGIAIGTSFVQGIAKGALESKLFGDVTVGEFLGLDDSRLEMLIPSKNPKAGQLFLDETEKFPSEEFEIIDSNTKNIASLVKQSKSWGADMAQNFADGMNSNLDEVVKGSKNIAEVVYEYNHHSTPDKGPLKDDDVWGEHFVQNFIEGITSQKSNLAKTVEDTAYILSDLYSMTDKNITTSIDVLTQDFKLPDMPKSVDIPFTSNANQIFSGVSKAVDDAKSRFDSITFPQPLYKIGYMEKPDTSAVQTAPSVTIQNVNVNVEDAKISSDYDVRELGDLLSDEFVETIGEKLKEMDIFGIRAKGGVVW